MLVHDEDTPSIVHEAHRAIAESEMARRQFTGTGGNDVQRILVAGLVAQMKGVGGSGRRAPAALGAQHPRLLLRLADVEHALAPGPLPQVLLRAVVCGRLRKCKPFLSLSFCAQSAPVVLRDNGVSMLSRSPDRRPPRVLNPYIQAPASTSTYDGRTTRPIPTSPPVSVRTDRGSVRPCAGSDGRARRTRRPANPCTCRAGSMTLILCKIDNPRCRADQCDRVLTGVKARRCATPPLRGAAALTPAPRTVTGNLARQPETILQGRRSSPLTH